MSTESAGRTDRRDRPRRVTNAAPRPPVPRPEPSIPRDRGHEVGGPRTSVGTMRRMPNDWRSAEIVDFLRRWCDYGGGSDYDIFVQFGLSADVFFRRAARLLRNETRHDLPPSTIAAMQEVCRTRLGITQKS